MKYLILHNPLAGHGTHEVQLKRITDMYGDNAEVKDITKIDSYESLISSLDADDVIVLCGGDGTINRFVNDTIGITVANDILYFPLGTGNDFLRDIEVSPDTDPFSIKKYIQKLPEVEVKGKKYRFLNNVGFGIDGYCCEVGDQIKLKSTKPVNYTAIAIKGLLFKFAPVNATVVVDGQTYTYKKVWIAPTMNGRFYGGGMMAAPTQDRLNSERELTLVIFNPKGRIKTLSIFPSIFKGEHINKANSTKLIKGKDIYVKFDRPTALQIDGETIRDVTEYRAVSSVIVNSTAAEQEATVNA